MVYRKFLSTLQVGRARGKMHWHASASTLEQSRIPLAKTILSTISRRPSYTYSHFVNF